MRTERGFDRLVNFSDAVVAIAITLLILPLVDTAGDLGRLTPLELLEENSMKLLVFVISFVVIGRFWMAHHKMFEVMVGYNPAIMWVNLLWLLTIVFLPFPTELIASSGYDSPTTTALYIGTMAATSLVQVWLQAIFIANPSLQAESALGTVRLTPTAISAALMLLALAVSQIPHVGLWALFTLALSGPAGAVVRRLQQPKAAPTP